MYSVRLRQCYKGQLAQARCCLCEVSGGENGDYASELPVLMCLKSLLVLTVYLNLLDALLRTLCILSRCGFPRKDKEQSCNIL